jgi:CubicO group peptidase (beta-lactamase class C family)
MTMLQRRNMMRRLLLSSLFLVLAASPVAAQEEAVRLQRAFERLDEFVAQHMREQGTPGVALAATDREGLLRVATYGLADVKARIPVTPQTLFEIGSISKSFTAIALLQLRDEGRFDPQVPLTKYLPWFQIKTNYAPLTGHHLLTHSGGLPRDRDDIPSSLYSAFALRERSTGYAPGVRFAYSNVGYQVLGYLLEELDRRPYGDSILQRILKPLGMEATEATITHSTRNRLAVGYVPFYDDRPEHPAHPIVEAPWLEYGAGDGSIATTPADLAAYLRMLLNRGAGPQGRILSKESFEFLIQRAIKREENDHYGYGIVVRQEEGHTIIGHGGGMVGYSSMLLGDMNDGLGVVVFMNGPGDPDDVAEFGLRVLRAALNSHELPPLPPLESPTKVKNAADYAGTYAGSNGKKLNLVAEGEKLLLLHGGERIALERRSKDRFFVNHPDFAFYLLQFGRNKDKTVVEATYGPDWYTNKRYQGPRQFKHPAQWQAYVGHYRTTDPWTSNFRLLLRKGKLWLALPSGGEMELVELEPGLFQVGTEETAERLRLDAIVNGKALRANLSGVDFYRTFTP